MNKTESTIVALFLVVACPLSFFVFAWWAAASCYLLQLIPMTETAVIASAFTGLALGIIVVILKLKPWARAFYRVRATITVPLYLFWSAMAIAFFMGLPLGNLILGLLAGLYVGRRQCRAGVGVGRFKTEARRASTFTAAVTGLISLAMGILAVQDQHAIESIVAAVGMDVLAATTGRKVALVSAAVPVLAATQYVLTFLAASWAFGLGRGPAQDAERGPCQEAGR